MADLAKLVVRLEAESLKFQKELEQAKRKLASFEKSGDKVAKAIGGMLGKLAAAVTVTAFTSLAKQALDVADATSKAAAKIGTTTEALSRMQHWADLGGVSVGQLETAMAKLNRQLVMAAQDSGSKAAVAFQAIGVSVTDANGKIRSSESVMADIADRFSRMRDGAGKTTVAMDLFGKAGASLIPVLNGGADGMRAAAAEADALGITIDGKAAKAAEQFNDNLSRLTKVIKGSFLVSMQELAPLLAVVSDELVQNAKDAQVARKGADTIVAGFKLLITAATVVKSAFVNLGTAIGGVAAAVASIDFKTIALNALGPLGSVASTLLDIKDGAQGAQQSSQILGQTFSDITANLKDDEEFLNKVWGDLSDNFGDAASNIKNSGQSIDDTLIGLGASAKKSADEQAKALEKLQSMEMQLRTQVETYGMAEGAVIRYRLAQGDLAEALNMTGEAGQKAAAAIIEMTDRLAEQEALTKQTELAQRVYEETLSRGRAVAESVRTPLEIYKDAIVELNDLLVQGAITQETYNRAVQKAGDDLADAKGIIKFEEIVKNMVQNVQGALSDFLFDPFADGTKSMGDKFSEMLRRMAAEAASAAIMQHLFGIGSNGQSMGNGGGLIGAAFTAIGAFAGFRANGGPVQAGQPYIVGERGPELMIPQSSGQVVSNRDLNDSGGTTVNMTVVTPDANSFRKSERQVSHSLKRGLNV